MVELLMVLAGMFLYAGGMIFILDAWTPIDAIRITPECDDPVQSFHF
jgi:hypothetical protein